MEIIIIKLGIDNFVAVIFQIRWLHATGNRVPAVEEEDFHGCPSRSPSTEAVTPVFADAVALLYSAAKTEVVCPKTSAAELRIIETGSLLVRHEIKEKELRTLKAHIREVEKQKDEMIAAARAKITEDAAKTLILERFRNLLNEQFDGYLRQYQRSFIAAVENLWQKYAVTTKQILAERDREAAQLDAFLKELGYE